MSYQGLPGEEHSLCELGVSSTRFITDIGMIPKIPNELLLTGAGSESKVDEEEGVISHRDRPDMGLRLYHDDDEFVRFVGRNKKSISNYLSRFSKGKGGSTLTIENSLHMIFQAYTEACGKYDISRRNGSSHQFRTLFFQYLKNLVNKFISQQMHEPTPISQIVPDEDENGKKIKKEKYVEESMPVLPDVPLSASVYELGRDSSLETEEQEELRNLVMQVSNKYGLEACKEAVNSIKRKGICCDISKETGIPDALIEDLKEALTRCFSC